MKLLSLAESHTNINSSSNNNNIYKRLARSRSQIGDTKDISATCRESLYFLVSIIWPVVLCNKLNHRIVGVGG